MKPKFTFLDLFAGIGGFRLASESLGGQSCGFSEIDKQAILTYTTNFLPTDKNLGNIHYIHKLNHIDLYLGGVPCQSWSIAGKKLGFDDPRGQLWFDVLRLIELNKPKAFLFENVKGLADPRNSDSLKALIHEFSSRGYIVKYKVLNASNFGLPQNRERIFIVGILNTLPNTNFNFPESEGNQEINLTHIIDNLPIEKIKHKNQFFILSDVRNGPTTIHSWDIIKCTEREKLICLTILKNRRKSKYGTKDGNPLSFNHLKELIPALTIYELLTLIELRILKTNEAKEFLFVNSKNSSGINGIYRIFLPTAIFPTLTATGNRDFISTISINSQSINYKSDFIKLILNKKNYRKLTIVEMARLQGFPDKFNFPDSYNVASKQLGNSIPIPVIQAIIKRIVTLLT